MNQIDFPMVRHYTLAPSLNQIGITSGLIRKEGETPANAGYNKNVLKLLDELGCPLLLMPKIKNNTTVSRIGFVADIRYIGIPTLSMLVRIANSFHAEIVVFNIADIALPEMADEYAKGFFKDKGMALVSNTRLKLVNVRKKISNLRLKGLMTKKEIDLLAATQDQKELLYQIAD